MMGTAPTMQIEENLALAARRGKTRGLQLGHYRRGAGGSTRSCCRTLGLGLEDRHDQPRWASSPAASVRR